MYHCIWEYRVRPGAEDPFVEHYRPSGSWASLFRRSEGYISTELLRDRADATRFLSIDRWTSPGDRAAFRRRFAQEYEALGRDCGSLTTEERLLGEFEAD